MYIEGAARIRYHGNAFMNEQARLSRDISIALAKWLMPRHASVLDATAATGIRGIRYVLEAGAGSVTFLEINASAFADLKRNVKAMPKGTKVMALNTSIQEFSNTASEKFDLIDLDPFGSAAPYIHDLLKVAKDGTLLFVTATDTALLCGAHSKACLRIYDALPMHNILSHETGLRILVGYVARIAAQFDFGVEVELAFTYMHYMRAMLVLRRGAKSVGVSESQLGYAYYCRKCCNAFGETGRMPGKQKCGFCGSAIEGSGLVWLGSLKSPDASKALDEYFGAEGKAGEDLRFASLLAGELDTPFYYSIPMLTKSMHMPSVPIEKVIEGLKDRGYKATRTTLEANCIKTDAKIGGVRDAVKDAGHGAGHP